VARLAASLFDQTRGVHGLTDREREWLEYAALMHDIGEHISYSRHHKHSYYLIKNGDLRGFEPGEIEIIALAARYHRSARPKKSHDAYLDLAREDRRRVRRWRRSCASPRTPMQSRPGGVGSSSRIAGRTTC
jgi:exopolyphosphatase/guanosine-5'-triphosphate,3'-diphosphate pyrophosphatase